MGSDSASILDRYSSKGSGSTNFPLLITLKWRCSPVERPVVPEMPIHLQVLVVDV